MDAKQDFLLLVQELAETRQTCTYLSHGNFDVLPHDWLVAMGFALREVGLETVCVSWSHAVETPYRHRATHQELHIECAFDARRLAENNNA
jgi:hypothetical protein